MSLRPNLSAGDVPRRGVEGVARRTLGGRGSCRAARSHADGSPSGHCISARALARHYTTAGLLGIALLLPGCPSAYQRTYDQRMQQLEQQQRADTAAAEAAHAQAQKYAAVVYFAVGSAAIDADGQREITWFVQQMQPYPQAIIEVQGFADDTGGSKTNVQLSQQRAANVAAALTAQGLAAPRLVTQGFGDQYPAASNVSARGRRNNRRVEVTVR